MTNTGNEEPYYMIDHAHCWEDNSPPCGQKIVHFKCCICGKRHPIIEAEVAAAEERVRKETLEKVRAQFADEVMGEIDGLLEKLK